MRFTARARSMRTVKRGERGRKTRIVSILFDIAEVSPLSEVMTRLFSNRLDTYAEQFPLKEGGASYTRVDAPLTTEVIQQHLNGEKTVGVYAINPKDQSCRWVCFDFDSETS